MSGLRAVLGVSVVVGVLASSSAGVLAQGDDDLHTDQSTGDGWLVWQGPSGLTLGRLDGSEQVALFTDGTRRGHADWSPDGTMLAYVRDEPDGTADIHLSGRDGSDDRLLIDCAPPCAFAEEPAWSPDGTRIAYWTNGDDQPQVIRVADATTGETLVTVPAPDPLIGPITPRWSPGGRYLTAHAEVYEQSGDEYELVDGRIGVIDLEADEPVMELITPVGMKAMYPDWSPDGSRILFVAGNLDPFFGSADPNDLYTILPDGTDLQRLTVRSPGDPRFGTPTWTEVRPPIVVTLIQGGAFTLGALEADGTGLREILDPDGRSLPGAHPRVWVEP